MKYVIYNPETRKYVNQPGSHNSYTERLQNARTFTTRDVALADACGNETVFSLEEAMRG